MSGGRWVEREHAWHDSETVQCMICGQLIPRRSWRFDGGAGELRACSPRCETLYESYWRPTYGTMEPDADH